MHPVIDGAPVTTPTPTDIAKEFNDLGGDHAGSLIRAIEVGRGELGKHQIPASERVVERVDVDRPAMGMTRPPRRVHGVAAHETRRVVGVAGRMRIELA